jgi:hypothetical protein
MPITAEFLADFSDFTRGAKEGERALNGLEQESKDFAKEFDKAVAGLDFEKLMTNPIGGAKDAIVSLTSVLPPMAQAAIASATALAGMAAASFKVADWTADLASNLGDLSDKTGVSVPALSRLSDAATVAGSDIEAVSNVLFAMNKQLAEHPTEFAAALDDIGLEFSSFMELKPDERLMAIAGALEAQVDPVDRVRAGTDLLGRSYKDMGPVLYDLADAMEMVGGIDPFTDEDAKTAEQFKMEVSALKLEFTAMARDIGATVLPAFTGFFNFLRENDALKFTRDYVERATWAFDALENSIRFITGNFVDMGPKVEGADQVLAGLQNTVESNALAMPSLTDAMSRLSEMTKEDEKATRAAEAEQKKMQEALDALAVSGATWQDVLAGMSGELIENIKYGIQANLTNEQMNTLWGAMVPQIKAVGDAMRAESAALKEKQDLEQARLTALQDLYEQYDAAVRASSGTTTQSRIDDAWRAADEQIKAMAKAGTFTEEAYVLIQRTAKQTADNIARSALEQDVYSKAHYEKLAADARRAYTEAAAASGEYSAARLEHLRLEAEKAEATLGDWQTAADNALKNVKGAADQAGDAMKRVADETEAATIQSYALGEAMRAIGEGSLSAMEQQRGHYESQRAIIDAYRAAGIPINISNIGGAASLSEGLKGGYAPKYPTVTINVQGSVLSTQHDLARAVGDALTNSYRSAGNRQPV